MRRGTGEVGGAPLRVLHVDAGREWRGGQGQLRLLAARMREEPGVEQAVATRRGSRVAEEVRDAGVAVIPLPWGPALDPRAVAGLAVAVRGWDVVHAHSSHALQAAALALALSGARGRLVAARRLDYRVSTPAVWRRADRVLAVSGAARAALVRSGVEPARVRVVPDGVDPGAVRPQRRGRLRAAAAAPEGTPLVGTAGALEEGKDHGTLVRAAARVLRRRPDVRFVVAGEGPRRGRLEETIAALGLEDHFSLPGHVPEVARSLGDLDLFVMPSREEGLGSAVLEAMTAGVPVVMTRAGGLAEVAGQELPSVPPEDPEALAEAILRLLDDPAAREEVRAAASRRVEAFSAEAMVRSTLRAYREVVAWAAVRREDGVRLAREGHRRRARRSRGGPPAGRGRGE